MLIGRRTAVGLFLLQAVLLSGCVRHLHTPYGGDRSQESSVRTAADTASMRPGPRDPTILTPRSDAPRPFLRPLPDGELDYGWHDGFLAWKPKPCTGAVEASAKVMISRRPGPKRWVVVLPIWGSSIYPPRQISRRLLRGAKAADTNVLWILGPDELFDWQAMAEARTEAEYLKVVEQGAECLAASVRDAREWIDWIATRDDYHPDRLGLVGFSIGAIAAATLVAVDPRPDATALVMGGGRLEHIFASCRGDARFGRNAASERFGWTREEFLLRIEEPLSIVDPVGWLSLAGNKGPAVDPSTLFFVSATKDTCVPEISRDSLWIALGRPERLQLPYGHKMSFLSMTFLGLHHTSHRVLGFLDRMVDSSDRPPGPPDLTTPQVPP
ncbi:MAG: hypothetical protein MPN21_06310 [Thermoanaerobaculia bacterium]|nr:hypothetical protein [Thermoanaerobaculia bacterium]